MKQLVETIGDIMLMDVVTGAVIRSAGATVVQPSTFTQERLATDLKIIASVNDEATDAEWLKYVAETDGDGELALASFLSAYPVESAVTELPAMPIKTKADKK